jgi:DNA-binding CsgD family transcriptional regulator
MPRQQEGLLEREKEMAIIRGALASARAGTGKLVAVEASAGMGKSSLLRVAEEEARAAGMTLLMAGGGEHEQALPFGAPLHLFQPILARATRAQRDALLSGPAALAAELLGAETAHSRPAGEREALTIIHGLFWLMLNICQPADGEGGTKPRPTAVLLDDVHLLDAYSLSFLVYVSRRLADLAAAMIVAFRPHGGSGATELQTLRENADTVIRPPVLSTDAIRKLLETHSTGEPVASDVVDECLRLTGGTPFLVRELSMELAAEGIPPTGDAVASLRNLVPEAVLQAAVARLARLGPAATQLAKVVAALGDGATVRAAAELADLDVEIAGAAADDLAAAGLFERGEPLRFSHDLIASSVRSDLPANWRARIELRAARQLAADGASLERVAAHLLGASRSGDGWVIQMLTQAADRARRRGAPDVASTYLVRALQEPPAPRRRPALLAALAEAEAAAGSPAALEHLAEALEEIDDPHERARLLGVLGRLLWARGRHEDATQALRSALAELDDHSTPLGRELKARVAFTAHQTGTSLDVLDAVIEELTVRPPGPDLPAERLVLATLAAREAVRGAPVDSFQPLISRAIQGDGLIDGAGLDAGMILTLAALALLHADNLTLSQSLLDAALARAREQGSVLAAATISYLRTWPQYFQGRIVSAIADAEWALAARQHGWGMWVGAASAVLTHARIDRGDLDGALQAVELGARLEIADQAAERPLLLIARAHLHLASGDPAAALADAVEAGNVDDALGVALRPVPWRVLAAEAALAIGQRARALEFATAEVDFARRAGSPRALGMALRINGVVHGGKAGIELLRHAVEVLSNSPSHLERARALVDLGALTRRTGARTASRDPLRLGLEIAERSGALRLAAQAREELRIAGAKPRRVAISGIDSLTPSERRVAELAASGMTNREIAQTLFVTPKTVDYHMRHVFQKLNLSSRRELARLLSGSPSETMDGAS